MEKKNIVEKYNRQWRYINPTYTRLDYRQKVETG
jgi:hypothetical protein